MQVTLLFHRHRVSSALARARESLSLAFCLVNLASVADSVFAVPIFKLVVRAYGFHREGNEFGRIMLP